MGRPDLSNWDPFKDRCLGSYSSEKDKERQDMKASYEKMSPEEQLKFKNDLYDGMVDDGTIDPGDMPR